MRLKVFIPVLLAIVSIGCDSTPTTSPVIGEAFAGPATLSLHQDIDPKSAVTAIAHHGDRLAIVAQRRRWYKVRTPKNAEGWTDDRQLLDTAQMNRLLALSKGTADLPSQGVASSFDTLNVHTEPNRLSPSFLQIKQGEKFDVLEHRVMARTPLPRRQLVAPKPKPERKKTKKKELKKGPFGMVVEPPPPVPPDPPVDWIALSKNPNPGPEENGPPAAHDDWSLIRGHDGQSGWVLTSRVYMAIPDEVAQYAEGHRITSYFPVGKVTDGDETKNYWLWTTASTLGEDHDFDGFRVFTWNVRRHRYETAYIERRERGFFPVLAKTGEFSVCLEGDDGMRVRKQFRLVGNLVKFAGQTACEAPAEMTDEGGEIAHLVVHEAPTKAGLIENLRARVTKIFRGGGPAK